MYALYVFDGNRVKFPIQPSTVFPLSHTGVTLHQTSADLRSKHVFALGNFDRVKFPIHTSPVFPLSQLEGRLQSPRLTGAGEPTVGARARARALSTQTFFDYFIP